MGLQLCCTSSDSKIEIFLRFQSRRKLSQVAWYVSNKTLYSDDFKISHWTIVTLHIDSNAYLF